MSTTFETRISLEQCTSAFLEEVATEGGPPMHTLAPADARDVLSGIQAGHEDLPPVDIEDRMLGDGPGGQVSVRIVRPQRVAGLLPAVMYFHGGGWVLGDRETHDRLLRELAAGAQAAVVFVNYSRSPEARYPMALEQAYAATRWVAELGTGIGVDGSHLAVAGDGAGGNLAACTALLATRTGSPRIDFQLLFYPVTDASLDTGSCREFADGPWLTRDMVRWFWDCYVPDPQSRREITASPLHGSLDELRGLPPALVITAENDVLRDEGEAYAHRLMAAGVPAAATRYLGTIHDFVLLNPITETPAPRAAIAQATAALRSALAGAP